MTYSIDGSLRVVGCHGRSHPEACTAKLERADGTEVIAESMPYQWDFHMDRNGPRFGSSYHRLNDAERSLIGDFLEEHGVAPATRFVEGSSITVRVRCDGVLTVHTWRAVLDDGITVPCETCPACVKQEPVTVLLASPVPDVPGAFISKNAPWMPTRRAAGSVPSLTFVPPSRIDVDRIGEWVRGQAALRVAAR
jgi:hypothetical protein